jgi:ABC-type nitrate/sulfonate/bicarbonate transport system permease component
MASARANRWPPRLASLAILIAAWELLARWINGLLFPSFTQTVAAALMVVPSPQFWTALWVSHAALIVGFGAAAVCGIAAGLAMGRWPAADAFIDPYLAILLVTPMSALIPVVILALGLKLLARATVVALFAIAVIAVNTRTGVRTLQAGWLEMARSFGASERQLWWTVVLPGALPAIMTGLRLGLGRAFTGMIAVELLLVAVGVGRLILEFQGLFEAGAVYAVILFLVVEAVVLLRLLRYAERRFAPWAGLVATE